MKVAYCSDLHLEMGTAAVDLCVDADVLVIAGDYCEVRLLDLQPASSKFQQGKQALDLLKQACNHYKAVIYVPGNHEYYHGRVTKTHDILRGLGISNLHVLINDTVTIEGFVFAGTTLWTYIKPVDYWFVAQRMNDYKIITMDDAGGFRKLRPADTVLMHAKALNFLATVPNADVVVTHHAPALASIQPDYYGNDLNCCYASPCDNLLFNKKLWIHGHMHDLIDYTLNGCNVVCNPRGYKGYELIANNFTVKVKTIYKG